METLRKEGLPVNEDLEKKANELEEDIIKKEILPVLSKTIEPALQPVKRELVLVVDYVPGQPLSDSSGLNVPPVAETNVPGIAETNVPAVAE